MELCKPDGEMPALKLWFFIQFFLIPILCLQEKHPSSISAILGNCLTQSSLEVTLVRKGDHWCCGSVGWRTNWRCPGRRERLQGVGTSPSWLGVRWVQGWGVLWFHEQAGLGSKKCGNSLWTGVRPFPFTDTFQGFEEDWETEELEKRQYLGF